MTITCCFTTLVQRTIARDYGIRDIPLELLLWLVAKHKARLAPSDRTPVSTVAFLVANDWQRGMRIAPC